MCEFGTAFGDTLDDLTCDRIVERLADHVAADACTTLQLGVGGFDLLLLRIAVRITPAKCSSQQVTDDARDSAREVRDDDIEELIRSEGGV